MTDYDIFSKYFYYSDSGTILWKKTPPNTPNCVGKIAGTIDKNYRRVRFKGKSYRIHRIVWLLHYKEWPTKLIDHKDRNTLNNKIENLRLANYRENKINQKIYKNNTSKHTGVHFRKCNNLYQARINIENKRINLGHFKNIEDAIKARKEAEIKYYGEFAPTLEAAKNLGAKKAIAIDIDPLYIEIMKNKLGLKNGNFI